MNNFKKFNKEQFARNIMKIYLQYNNNENLLRNQKLIEHIYLNI